MDKVLRCSIRYLLCEGKIPYHKPFPVKLHTSFRYDTVRVRFPHDIFAHNQLIFVSDIACRIFLPVGRLTGDGRRPGTPAGHVTSATCSCCRRSPRRLSVHLRVSLPRRPPPPGTADRRGGSCNRGSSPPPLMPPAAAEPRSRNRSRRTSSSSPPSTPLASGTRSHAAQVRHMNRVFWLVWVNDYVGVCYYCVAHDVLDELK